MPAATERPCPNEPVPTSTKLSLGVGCPSKSLSNFLRFNNSLDGNKPASAHATIKYKIYYKIINYIQRYWQILQIITINIIEFIILNFTKIFN